MFRLRGGTARAWPGALATGWQRSDGSKTGVSEKHSDKTDIGRGGSMAAKGQRKANGHLEFAEAPSYLMRRCQQLYGDLYARETGARDLTKQQFTVLCALEHHEGASQTALVEMTGIDRSTLAEMVRRMLEKGLITRERTEEDQRANAVAITAGRTQGACARARTAVDRAEKSTARGAARRRPRPLCQFAGRHCRRRRGHCRSHTGAPAPQGRAARRR